MSKTDFWTGFIFITFYIYIILFFGLLVYNGNMFRNDAEQFCSSKGFNGYEVIEYKDKYTFKCYVIFEDDSGVGYEKQYSGLVSWSDIYNEG